MNQCFTHAFKKAVFPLIALGLTISPSAFTANAVKLKFITSAQTVQAGQCSAIVRIQSQDAYSYPAYSSASRMVNLYGTGFTFFSDIYCSMPVTSVKIPAYSSKTKFYFKNTVPGKQIITASSSGLLSAQQTETIVAAPSPTPTPSPSGGVVLRPITYPLYGVTTDSVDNISGIIQSLQNLSKKPITRVVFDEWVSASYYKDPVSKIYPVSYVMGEILDSFYVKQYTLEQYKQRTTEYLNTLGNLVDIWEIGNEMNGEWLGSISSVVPKMTSAYDLVKARGARTALTLYYNEDCWMYPSEEMFTWATQNIPSYMKQGLDFVFVSYYEDDCNGLQPDWLTVFQRLASLFPNSKIGFGEVGTIYSTKKAEFIDRYYNLTIPVSSYVGGYFWWYFRQDMVPYTQPLWNVLNTAIQ